MSRLGRAFALAALLIGAAFAQASAHETTKSFVSLTRDGPEVEARLRVAFRDIEVAVWMDEDLDGRITWGEARRRLEAVDAYARAGFRLDAGGACALERVTAAPSTASGVAYLDLGYVARCPSGAAPLTLTSHLFSEIDPDHRQFVQAMLGGAARSAVLSAAAPAVTFDGDAGGAWGALAAYFTAGVEHLAGGADHVVFLLALMLPAVCAGGAPRRAAAQILTAVTGFTLAHAVTLTAATTEILRPPAGVVEMLIALSIVVTAADNIRPFLPAPRAAVAAFFGIIHGFGFASALGALELSGGALALALLGFNLGVEAAQVAVVLVTMPALYMLGAGRRMLWIGSGLTGTVGLVWLGARLAPLL